MTEEKCNEIIMNQVIEIFKKDSDLNSFKDKDNAFEGMKIISKYTNNIIHGADHDIIYSEDIEKLLNAGMKLYEFELLRKLNWMIEGNTYLACFV